MFNHPFALELSYIAVEEAIRLGASYADARYELHQREDVGTRNGQLAFANSFLERGLGLRVLVRGTWGFVGVSEPTRHDVAVAARRAVEMARAAAVLQDRPVELADQSAQRSIYRTQIKRDPLAVPLEDKVALLLSIDEKLRVGDRITLTEGNFSAHRRRKIFVSSDGSEIDQELVSTGVGYRVGAQKNGEIQVRSFPGGARGICMGKGWELVSELPLLESAEGVAREAIELLDADACPDGVANVVLSAPMVAHHLHATVGPLFELDRTLGTGSSDEIRSFLTTDELGRFALGSTAVSIYADARMPGAAGSFGFDDDGVEAQRVDLVTEGRVTGYLTSRETARRVGLERSLGGTRSAGWAQLPAVRLTNIGLEPGDAGDLDAMLADLGKGVLVDGPRGATVSADGRGFVSAAEMAWQIEGGKRARPLKNPVIRGDVTAFWRGCTGVGGEDAWTITGTASASKGRPRQLLGVGMAASPARFDQVSLGNDPVPASIAVAGDALPRLDQPDAGARTVRPRAASSSKRKRGGAKKKRARKKDTK